MRLLATPRCHIALLIRLLLCFVGVVSQLVPQYPHCLNLVHAPSELAFQLADQFRALGAGITLRDAVVVGGLEMQAQAKALARRPHIVIATPGRLRVGRGSAFLDNLILCRTSPCLGRNCGA